MRLIVSSAPPFGLQEPQSMDRHARGKYLAQALCRRRRQPTPSVGAGARRPRGPSSAESQVEAVGRYHEHEGGREDELGPYATRGVDLRVIEEPRNAHEAHRGEYHDPHTAEYQHEPLVAANASGVGGELGVTCFAAEPRRRDG